MTRWSTCLCVWLAAWPAAAQADPPPGAAADEALAGARAALIEADPGRAYELARLARAFDDARSVEAWELMGRAASEMGQQELAHRCFRRALGLADPATRHRLLARMQLARDELGIVHVDVQPGGAALLVDGEPAEYEAGEDLLLLRPGSHRLEARLEGHEARYAVVQVTAGGTHELHLVLPEGLDDAGAQPSPRPSTRRVGQRWLTGNALLIGIGGLGLAAAGSADANVPALGDAMSLQLGVSLGLALGAGLNMAIQAAFDAEGEGWLMIPRVMSVGLLAGVALGLAVTSWQPACPETELAECQETEGPDAAVVGTSGVFAGIAIATMANVGLGHRDVPLAVALGTAFLALAGFELAYTADAAGVASERRARAAEVEGAEAQRLLEEASARDGLAQVTGGLSIGFAALAVSSFVLGFAGDSDALDLAVAAGPGTLSVSGRF
ncbi:MAG: hypothetical protein KC619_03370 [Myxococcales bacterium]|nr:hypothetical protein [Myxococcales bacterium]